MRLLSVLLTTVLLLPAAAARADRQCHTAAEIEAAEAVRFHTELLVGGLTCQDLGGAPDTYEQYKLFTRNQSDLIDRYEDILKDRFGRLGAADPEAEVKHYRTELANRLADQVANTHLKIYCAGQEALLDHWVPLDAETLETYARRRRFMEADRYDAC